MLFRTSRTHALALALVSSLTSVASASDWYVDAVNGSNVNNGSSPSTAWRTITHAVASVPVGAIETIHVAPGTYDPGLGEVFPIVMQPGFQLVGDPNHPRPVLADDPLNLQANLIVFWSHSSHSLTFDSTSRLEHLLLLHPTNGILILSDGGGASPTLVDLAVEQCRSSAVTIETTNGGSSRPTIERLRATGAGWSTGIAMFGQDSPGAAAELRDSVLTQFSVALQVFGSVDLDLVRCRLDNNEVAVSTSTPAGGAMAIEALDCSLSGNSRSGVFGFTSTGQASASTATLRLVRCTVAHNAERGIAADSFGPSTLQVELDHTIVAGNGVDLSVPNTVAVRRCLIGDGQYSGVNGTFAADPEFVAPPQGDFRLRWGSPCIDAAFVDAPAGTRDLVGAPRDLDGNLDTLGKTDLGAYEFQPLELTTTGAIGSSLMLENWGPNTLSTIYWARTGLAGSQATPFGAFVLHPQLARTFRFTTAGASAPIVTLRPIPNQLALVGHTFSFQALTDSPAAPLSRAFSNGVEFTVTP